MLAVIDDSGDPGFSEKNGSSTHFVLACVIFDDELEAEKAALAIKVLRRTLFKNDTTEFKFSHSRRAVREQFLTVLKPFNFTVRAIVVEKKHIYSQELKSSQDSFYNYCIKSLLKDCQPYLKDVKIKLDGHGDRAMRKNLQAYLKRFIKSPTRSVIKKLRMVDSKKDVLIQLADMIVGSIRRSYEVKKSDVTVYRELLGKKLTNCWEFK